MLQPMGSQKVGHDLVTEQELFKNAPDLTSCPNQERPVIYSNIEACEVVKIEYDLVKGEALSSWCLWEEDGELEEGQFSSAAQLCLTLCDPMDCSTPGLPSVQFSSVQSLSHVRLFVTP